MRLWTIAALWGLIIPAPAHAFVVAEAPAAARPPPRAAAGWFAQRMSGARHRRALANPSASIRRAAAESLRRAGDRELAVEALAAQLGPERDPRVREAMAQTLAYLGAGRDALIEAFAGPSAVAADALAVALASLGDGPSIDALVEA
ncbi:MAG: hypothetical protein AAF645_27960, partial [Myxococcota bacterium]